MKDEILDHDEHYTDEEQEVYEHGFQDGEKNAYMHVAIAFVLVVIIALAHSFLTK